MSKSATCTRNSQIQRNIEDGRYVHNGRFRDYGTLAEDVPNWDMRARSHAKAIQAEKNAQILIRKHG